MKTNVSDYPIGANMLLVRDLMGHSNLSTTELYSHSQSDVLDDLVDSQE